VARGRAGVPWRAIVGRSGAIPGSTSNPCNNRMWHVSCVLDNHPILSHRSTTKINSVEMQGSQENSVDNFLSAKNALGLNFWL
jgi:hypothetical protein